MNISAIFEPKQHYLTTVYRDGRRNAKRIRIKSKEQLERLVEQQPKDTDLYITKYARDDIVWNIILDFDSEDDKSIAWNDCLTISKFLERKGIDCVIVDSTNKGYHLYVMIPPTNFRKFGDDDIEEPSLFFKYYVIELLNLRAFKLISLDEVNFNSSLNGNIRLIGSIHPKTNKQVHIIQGEFHDIMTDLEYYENAMHYHTKIVEKAFKTYNDALDEIELKRLQYGNQLRTDDDLLNKDLRDVFKELFNLRRVKEYGDNLWCSCPKHQNDSVNFCVNPNFFFCTSCGWKGNIFTLISENLIEMPKSEYWITNGAKKLLKENNNV